VQNALVKRAASLHLRKFREREGAFLVEGADLVTAGLAAGRRPQAVFILAESVAAHAADPLFTDPQYSDIPVYPVTDKVAAKITTLETAPDVIAVFDLLEAPPLASLAAPDALAVYVDGIGDPGNMGTLIRAAVAFGVTALIASPKSVDLFSPKCLRAGMGAVFSLPLYTEMSPADVAAAWPKATIYGLVAHGGAALDAVEVRRPAVVCVGAERAGLSAGALSAVHQKLTISLAPTAAGAVESLNAGVAGAIALYEFACHSRHATKGDHA
jgi:TrmH family RNA methyltransferase